MTRISDPHGGRSLEEWIGATPDTAIPDWVRDRVFVRAKRRCHITGRRIRPGDAWQLEHIKPLALGGQNREGNLAPALTEPHKEKTAAEVAVISKADRIRRKNDGTWPKPVGNAVMRSRRFQSSRKFEERRA